MANSRNGLETSHFKPDLSALNDIFKRVPCGICQIIYDNQLSIQYANEYFYKLFEFDFNEGNTNELFNSFSNIFSSENYKKAYENMKKNIEHGHYIFDFELPIIKQKNLHMIWFLIKCSYSPEDNTITCAIYDVTKQKQREEKLRISEEMNRIALQHENIMTIRYHVPTRTLYCPKKIGNKFKMPTVCPNWPDDAGKFELVVSNLEEYKQFYEAMVEGKPVGSIIVQLKDYIGDVGWYNANYTLKYDINGEPMCSLISFKDITEQREKTLAYEKWKQTFEFQQIDSIGYYESNLTQDDFEHVEGLIANLLPQVQRCTFSMITYYVANNLVYYEDKDKYLENFSRETLLSKYANGEKELQFEHRRLDISGKPFWASAMLQMFTDPYSGDVKCFTVIKNINQDKQAMLELEERSKIDKLTGLLNRITTIEKINDVFSNTTDTCHALIMLDIDYFKQLNDNLGHAYGDRVLQETSSILREKVGENDIVGRIGGDEFIICLKDICVNTLLHKKLKMLCKNINRHYQGDVEVTGSFGVAIFPRDGHTFEELYLKADTALYEAKRLGRNQYVIFSKESNSFD